ncbi:MAG: hypothetical protein O7D96_06995, partial [SAR324 cluster bacterium]|nr:hypothetical protein [SAR324 cluster bacterium]
GTKATMRIGRGSGGMARRARRIPGRSGRAMPAIPLIVALMGLLIATGLVGCLEEAADKDFKFDNPLDTTPADGDDDGDVAIAYVDTANEIVVIVNQSNDIIVMDNWELAAEDSGDVYTFLDFSLFSRVFVRIRTGSGTDDENDLYWEGTNHWTSSIDTATLRDATGNAVVVCSFTSSSAFDC